MSVPLYNIKTPNRPNWFWHRVRIVIWRMKYTTGAPNDDPMVKVDKKMVQAIQWLDSLHD